jgi:NADH:ubiquinone reductase (H+-translocating)
VLVIGAGFGGLEVAKALGKAGLAVTVIDRHNHHRFQPLLY